MDVDQILQQHVRILHAIEGLEGIAAKPRPERVHGLAEHRWRFARDMFLHCSRMQSEVYAPLSADARPEAANRAHRANAELTRFVIDFRNHVEAWHGLPAKDRWEPYRAALGRLAATIRNLIECEARMIVPLLPVRPSGQPVPRVREHLAGDAWEIRELIYREDQRPVE